MASASSGEELPLLLPAAAPVPEVSTRTPQVVAADANTLYQLARALGDRLTRSHRRVEVWAERSHGAVQVANTRAALAGYDVTLAGVGALVESIGAGWAPPLRVHCAAAALPTLLDVETLVTEVDQRLDPGIVGFPAGFPHRAPVYLGPRAVATLLRPVKAALTGYEALLGSSPFRGRLHQPVLHPALTLSDDPLAPGRPGSRPVDDDGVPSRKLPLVSAGHLTGVIADLQLGARAGVPSTGHAWRFPGSAPRIGFTNLRLAPGVKSRAELLAEMEQGLLVADLDWGTGPNGISGAIRLKAPWAYLVQGGAVRGRLEGVVLSGNVFEALRGEVAVGDDATWIGAQCLPTLVVRLEVRGER
jgi:PmbA protein